jgi:mannose-6-phosphate isomerase
MNRGIIPLPPNRARRNYKGGKLLDALEGKDGVDCNRPEDWIASFTPARNPGMLEIENEGLATILDDDGNSILLKTLVENDPVYFLGEQYINDHGTSPPFLLKLLDSATRLNVQVHPTRDFAQQYLESPFGKLECYYILGARPGINPSIRLGFQHPPDRDEFKRVVLAQDIPAMDAWFDPVPVKPGESWLIPGGTLHAIGEGLLLVEIQEPSDLTVRFEFERGGIVVPPEARFLGRDIDFVMDMLDFSQVSIANARKRFKLQPKFDRNEEACTEETLVGEDRVDSFRMKKITTRVECSITKDPQLLTGIVIGGTGTITAARESIAVQEGSKFLVPAAVDVLTVSPARGQPMTFLACLPGKP